MRVGEFKLFPPDRMSVEFPWQFWSIGWLALFKAFLWLAYEPVQDESTLYILGIRFLVNILPLSIFAIGVWNMRRWAVWGLMVVSVANLLFFIVNPQMLNAVVVHSEVYIYAVILSFMTLLCNGPLGDLLIVCALPSMLKHTR